MRAAPWIVACVVLAAPALDTQANTPVFHVRVEMVDLTIAIVDDHGKYVSDIPCSAFTVRENGDLQAIELCEKQALPIDLVLLMDASASMNALGTTAQEAATKFVRTLRDTDRAKLMQFGERVRTVHDFTSNRAILEKSIADMEFNDGATHLYMDLYVALRELESEGSPKERRKVIILLTDGEDTASLLTDDQVITEASRHSSVVYPILIRPLENVTGGEERDRLARYFAQKVASATGGKVTVIAGRRALKDAYELITEELKVQYRLGYYPTHPRDPGPQRTISVMVARERVTLRHRQMYWVQKGRQSR